MSVDGQYLTNQVQQGRCTCPGPAVLDAQSFALIHKPHCPAESIEAQMDRTLRHLIAGHDPVELGYSDIDVQRTLRRCRDEQRRALATKLYGRRRRTYRAADLAYDNRGWLWRMSVGRE